MNTVEKRKAVARDIIARLDAGTLEAYSTYLYFASEKGNTYDMRSSDWMSNLFESKQVTSCMACQRGAMAISMLSLGYDGDPKDARPDDGWYSVLRSLYPTDQIELVENYFELRLGFRLSTYIADIGKYSYEQRMRTICNRMIESEDGLFCLTPQEEEIAVYPA